MLNDDYILSRISRAEFTRIGKKTTICCLVLLNGFEVIGKSACVNPDDYNEELGQKYALEDAVSNIWQLEGYLQQEKGNS